MSIATKSGILSFILVLCSFSIYHLCQFQGAYSIIMLWSGILGIALSLALEQVEKQKNRIDSLEQDIKRITRS